MSRGVPRGKTNDHEPATHRPATEMLSHTQQNKKQGKHTATEKPKPEITLLILVINDIYIFFHFHFLDMMLIRLVMNRYPKSGLTPTPR